MKQQVLVPGYVITTQVIGKTNFIAGQSTRTTDNKYLVNLTPLITDAKPFELEHEAEIYIGKIHNLHNREFKIIPAMVDPKDFKAGKIFNHGKPVKHGSEAIH